MTCGTRISYCQLFFLPVLCFFPFQRRWCEMVAVVAARRRSAALLPCARLRSVRGWRKNRREKGTREEGKRRKKKNQREEGQLGGRAGHRGAWPTVSSTVALESRAGVACRCAEREERRTSGDRMRRGERNAQRRKWVRPCPLNSMRPARPASTANIRLLGLTRVEDLPSKHLPIWVEPAPT
jgi:hypothetical protein